MEITKFRLFMTLPKILSKSEKVVSKSGATFF
jgi:hypothetical protein